MGKIGNTIGSRIGDKEFLFAGGIGGSLGGGGGLPPVNTTAPAISGVPIVGQTLTSTTGTWSNSPTFSYQWKRAGVDIGGATSSTYVLQSADDNNSITCSVTGTNGDGSASAGSNGLLAALSALWLDANDSSTITQVAGLVSVWGDKSTNGRNATQGTMASQPLTGTRTLNSKNVIDFDGIDDGMVLPSGIYTVPNAANTIFYVGQIDLFSGNRLILGQASTSRFWHIRYIGSGTNYSYNNAAGQSTAANKASNTSPHVVIGFTDGTTNYINIDGGNSTAGTNTSPITLTSCVLSDVAASIDGSIAEIIVFPRNLSLSEKNQFAAILGTKWGITVATIV